MSLQQNAVALALDSRAPSDKPVWIQIAKVGQWAGHVSGPFKLGTKEFSEIVSNFRASTNRRIPIDFEHSSEMDPREGSVPTQGAPAQGWMIDLDNRGGAGLWALVEWLEPARSYIREGKYRFFSPTIRFNARDPESGARQGARLSSGALTNMPFLDGMAPLAAKATGDDSGEEQVINLPNTGSHVEHLIAEGKTPQQAHAIALAASARALASALGGNDVDEVAQLGDRVRAGEATIVQLAEKIAARDGNGRDLAFSKAERLLRAR